MKKVNIENLSVTGDGMSPVFSKANGNSGKVTIPMCNQKHITLSRQGKWPVEIKGNSLKAGSFMESLPFF